MHNNAKQFFNCCFFILFLQTSAILWQVNVVKKNSFILKKPIGADVSYKKKTAYALLAKGGQQKRVSSVWQGEWARNKVK